MGIAETKMIELNSLVGKRMLSGVDIETHTDEDGDEEGQAIIFILDGIAYRVEEDPEDGYRSSMKSLTQLSASSVDNRFPAIPVIGKMHIGNDGEEDYFELYDVHNMKVVLSVGTDYSDDYYPGFVANWSPENVSHEANRNARIKQNLQAIKHMFPKKE